MLTLVPDLTREIGDRLDGDDLIAYSILNHAITSFLHHRFWHLRVERRWGVLKPIEDPRRVYIQTWKMLTENVGIYSIEHHHDDLLHAVLKRLNIKKELSMSVDKNLSDITSLKFLHLTVQFHRYWAGQVLFLASAATGNIDTWRIVHKTIHQSLLVPNSFVYTTLNVLILLNRGTDDQYRFFEELWNKDTLDIPRLPTLLLDTKHGITDWRIIDLIITKIDLGLLSTNTKHLSQMIKNNRLDLIERIVPLLPIVSRQNTLDILLAESMSLDWSDNRPSSLFNYLIDQGARASKITTLQAIHTKSYNTFLLLLDRGLQIFKTDPSALIYAADHDLLDLFTLLLRLRVDCKLSTDQILIGPSTRGQTPYFELLLQHGGSSILRTHHDSALRIATYNNHHHLILWLLDKGCDARRAVFNAQTNRDEKTIALINNGVLNQAVLRMTGLLELDDE